MNGEIVVIGPHGKRQEFAISGNEAGKVFRIVTGAEATGNEDQHGADNLATHPAWQSLPESVRKKLEDQVGVRNSLRKFQPGIVIEQCVPSIDCRNGWPLKAKGKNDDSRTRNFCSRTHHCVYNGVVVYMGWFRNSVSDVS